MRHKLREREESGERIKVGVIGAGVFSCLTIGQVSRMPGITTSMIAHFYRNKAIRAFTRFARRKPGEIVEVNDADTANAYMEKNVPVITTNRRVLMESDVDVILESTGAPEAAARHAYEAIGREKHLVMASVEAECVVGPHFSRMAQEKGVVYGQAYGDQPALICELYDWALSSGFKVVAARPGKDATVVAVSRMVSEALSAAEALASEGISIEVIDPRTLVPLNTETILSSAKKTARLITAEDSCSTCGVRPILRSHLSEISCYLQYRS